MVYNLKTGDIANYFSTTSFPQKAHLSFYESAADFPSLSSVPFIHIFFSAPNMKAVQYIFPSGSEFYPLALIEDKVGSNRFSNAETMRCNIDHLHFDAPSQQITSLRLFGKYCYTDSYLQIVAAHCPNLVRLDLHHSQGFLNDLNGLNAIASLCAKLSCLNLATDDNFHSLYLHRLANSGWNEQS